MYRISEKPANIDEEGAKETDTKVDLIAKETKLRRTNKNMKTGNCVKRTQELK